MPEEEGITKKRPKNGARDNDGDSARDSNGDGPRDANGASYKAAGVDIDAGAALVEAIRPLAEATRRPGAASDLGGFGGLFDLKAAGFKDPVLVSGTDGVGTKVLVAEAAGHHDAIGIDLVAMCVNDIVAVGAEPLFFLDYMATGKLDVGAAVNLVKGIAEGCRQAGCALIGGETAEMPGLYEPGRYDLAGFCVGAAERDQILTPDGVKAGDAIIGLASSGLHANGFSLVRKIVADAGLDYGQPAPFDEDRPLGRALLDPTKIYVKSCLAALATGGVTGLAHITGGGLVENLPRALPQGLMGVLDAGAWTLPGVFAWLAETGSVPAEEMARTFNCGIGMAVIASSEKAADVAEALADAGELAFPIGTVEKAGEDAAGIGIDNLDSWPS